MTVRYPVCLDVPDRVVEVLKRLAITASWSAGFCCCVQILMLNKVFGRNIMIEGLLTLSVVGSWIFSRRNLMFVSFGWEPLCSLFGKACITPVESHLSNNRKPFSYGDVIYGFILISQSQAVKVRLTQIWFNLI